MKNNRAKNMKEKDYSLFYILIPILFLIPFLISYFFTKNLLERKIAVSGEEEAKVFTRNINEKDLNNLYLENNLNLINKEAVKILAFHQVREIDNIDTEKEKLFITSTETFEKEMKYLRDHDFETISISQYIDYLKNKNQKPLPKRPIIITFDDGYLSQYTNAFPILKKYNFSATFFVYSDCIDKYPICMKKENLRDMAKSGMKIANHTSHHLYLSKFSNNLIKKEIIENQNYLENNFDVKNIEKVLAYPFGITNNNLEKIVKDLDYEGAVGVSFFAKNEGDKFNLPRYLLGNNFETFLNILNK